MGVAMKLGEAIDEVPNRGVAGVKDMRAIFVDLDSFDFAGKAIAADVVSTVDNEHATACFSDTARKNRSK
jgi:hypothetical protein